MECCDRLSYGLGAFVQNVEPLTRIWGTLTSIVLLAVGADLCFVHQLAGGFTIAAALITFFLETTWALTILLQIFLRNENHPCFTCWDVVLWFDTWKRSLVYAVLAALLFAQPHRAWFSTLGAMTLTCLSLLHGVRCYRDIKNGQQVPLIEQQEDGFSHNDEMEIDLSLPNEPATDQREQESASELMPNDQLRLV